MKRTIQVYLGDDARRVGTLHFDAVGTRQHSAFAYEDSWLKAAECFALDPGMPLVTGPQYHGKAKDGSVFHAAIADTEPDGSHTRDPLGRWQLPIVSLAKKPGFLDS
jgi:serine/threonine-protein kinase HipA